MPSTQRYEYFNEKWIPIKESDIKDKMVIRAFYKTTGDAVILGYSKGCDIYEAMVLGDPYCGTIFLCSKYHKRKS